MVALNETYRKTLTPERSAKDSGYRFYSPEISRWLSRDPIGESWERWSSYSFVFNNPITQVDILGLDMMQHCEQQANRFNMGLPTGNAVVDAIGGFLRDHTPKCKAEMKCIVCEECKTTCPGGKGCAKLAGEGWGTGNKCYPEHGTCTAYICPGFASGYTAMYGTMKHELTHCKQFCTGEDYKTWNCETCLCKEIQATHVAGTCAADPNYEECLRKQARLSCKLNPSWCGGKTDAFMNAIMTAAFVTSCKASGTPSP